MSRRSWSRVAAVGLAALVAACSVTNPEGDFHSISGEAPAAAEAVFLKAEAWLQGRGYELYERRSPDLIRARKALSGQDRRGRIDFSTSLGTASTTKYEVASWTEILGIQTRENDVEMQADAQSLSSALVCPAARWPSCP